MLEMVLVHPFGAALVMVGLILLCFAVYVIYKQLEFVFVSVKLYRKMVQRQDAIVGLLLDIRDGTKHYAGSRGGGLE